MTPDTSGLTPRQTQVLQTIAQLVEREGWPPSYRELCDATGIKSTRDMHDIVHELRQAGKVVMGGGKRQLKVVAWEQEALARGD